MCRQLWSFRTCPVSGWAPFCSSFPEGLRPERVGDAERLKGCTALFFLLLHLLRWLYGFCSFIANTAYHINTLLDVKLTLHSWGKYYVAAGISLLIFWGFFHLCSWGILNLLFSCVTVVCFWYQANSNLWGEKSSPYSAVAGTPVQDMFLRLKYCSERNIHFIIFRKERRTMKKSLL